MESGRRKRAMLRIPLVTFLAFAAFWAVWWFVTGGDVPRDDMFQLSRALDGIPAALLALVLTAALTGGSRSKEDQRRAASNFVAAACLVGIAFGLFQGMLTGLLMAVFILNITLAIAVLAVMGWILASSAFWRKVGNWLTGG